MKKILLTFILSSISVLLFAQGPNFQWAKKFGGSFFEEGFAITTDDSGNVYTTGMFKGVCDFDPGVGVFNLSSPLSYNVFVSKQDAQGNLVWARQLGGAVWDDLGQGIKVDASGNVFIAGYFYDTADFDPGPGTAWEISNGATDVFLCKLDAGGNLVWVKTIGGADFDNCWALDLDAAGNPYLCGNFVTTVDFDPGPGVTSFSTAGYNIDMFICKLDMNGNFVWARQIGGVFEDRAIAIDVDQQGNVITTGLFQQITDFDPGPGTFNLTAVGSTYDVFISKLDNNGNFIWAKSFVGTGNDIGAALRTDASGNIHLTGYFTDQIDFDTGPGTFNLNTPGAFVYHAYVCKLNSNGDLLWAKDFGQTDYNKGQGIAVDKIGNVLTTGVIQGTVDFDPGPGVSSVTTPANEFDIYIHKMDSLGNFLWARNVGDVSKDEGFAICVDTLGYIYATGYFHGSSDFNPTPGTNILSATNLFDVFVLKWHDCIPTSVTQSASACGSYYWPEAYQTYTSSGIYTAIGLDQFDCPTYYTLNLTIKPVPAVTSANATFCPGSAAILTGSPAGGTFSIPNPYSGPATTFTYTYTAINGCSSTAGPYSVNPVTCWIKTVKAYIQAYYNQGSGFMNKVLYQQGQESNPFTNNTDTATIELRSPVPPYDVQYSYTGLLQTDGSIACQFPGAILGMDYYIVVRHRNAVTTWSASPVNMNSTPFAYDFTTSANHAYGMNQIQVAPGVWALYSGDINQDGGIDGDDFNALDPDVQAGNGGYLNTDLDGSGGVDGDDFNIFDPNAQIGVGQITP
ncbi:MAG: hypothetical protein JNJ58_04360 [Chitinophagaceae bacterium]|nr:hypothetical protein [Chitinophagaceae bacterium]